MNRSRALRVWVETLLAAVCASLFLLTLLWRDWIEAISGVDPDHGDGSLELLVPVILLAGTIALGICARHEWRVRRRISVTST